MTIESIKARLEAATPEPWLTDEYTYALGETGDYGSELCVVMEPHKRSAHIASSPDEQDSANADLIAHAPTDLRALLKVAEVAIALYGAGYWSRSSQGYKDEDDRTYWDAMKNALAELEGME